MKTNINNIRHFYAYELTTIEHNYKNKHLCTAKNQHLKMRLGFVLNGTANFMYNNNIMAVKEKDIIFIPEKIFCHSEWTGTPDIRVIYLSFKLNIDSMLSNYNLQILHWDNIETQTKIQNIILQIHNLLQEEQVEQIKQMEAYSFFYSLLTNILPIINVNRSMYGKELCEAIDYISSNWNKEFLFVDVAKNCCSSESKLYKLFKEQLKQTPIDYLNTIKINYSLRYLESGEYSVSQVALICNFHSESYFRKVFNRLIGCNPSIYKKTNK